MKNALNFLAVALETIVATLFVTVFLVTMLNITLRNLGGITWLWIPGFTRLVFIWLVFLGIAAVYRRADHLTVDYFLLKLNSQARTYALVAINIVLMPFFSILVGYGLQIALVRMRIPFDTWAVPTGYAYMAVPAAGVLLLLFCLERLVMLFAQAQRGKVTERATH